MLFFLITCCFSFILFHKSLALDPLPSWACEMRLLSLWFWKDFSVCPCPIITKSIKSSIVALSSSFSTSRMLLKKKSLSSKVKSTDDIETTPELCSVLDLPDLVLESILEKLTPEGLCRMATVCRSLRDRCVSDHLWERHMKNKWGRIIGISAFERWHQFLIGSRKGSIFAGENDRLKGLAGFVSHLWPFKLIRSGFITSKKRDFPCDDSLMSFYLALESGKFWFPAQVYNRENGHVGFLLSCYDAELSYDRKTDAFQARYPPHGRKASPIEISITWDRIRSSLVDTSPLDLHVSNCLNDLQPGDQIEIQWRRNKDFPYGWWYGVVGHLETCDRNANYCRCRHSEIVVLEFKQYSIGSRWRTMTINRKDHREEGDEAVGFYGGIRKILCNQQQSTWKNLWPVDIILE